MSALMNLRKDFFMRYATLRREFDIENIPVLSRIERQRPRTACWRRLSDRRRSIMQSVHPASHIQDYHKGNTIEGKTEALYDARYKGTFLSFGSWLTLVNKHIVGSRGRVKLLH